MQPKLLEKQQKQPPKIVEKSVFNTELNRGILNDEFLDLLYVERWIYYQLFTKSIIFSTKSIIFTTKSLSFSTKKHKKRTLLQETVRRDYRIVATVDP